MTRVWTLMFFALCTLALAAATGPSEISAGLDTLAVRIVGSCQEEGLKRIAVVEFTDLNGDVDELGDYVSEELVTRLVPNRRVEVIDCRVVRQVLQDEDLPVAAMLSPAASEELRKTLKLDAIVTGTMARLAGAIRLSARVISVPTGVISAVAVADVREDSLVEGLSVSLPPHGRVANTSVRLEGENLHAKTRTGGLFGGLQYTSRWGSNWSNNAHGWWYKARLGDRLTLVLPVAQNGRYRIMAQFTKAANYGNVQLYLDGRKLGQPFAGYSRDVIPSGIIDLGTARLKAGDHELTVELVGEAREVDHDVNSLGFAIDYIDLNRVE